MKFVLDHQMQPVGTPGCSVPFRLNKKIPEKSATRPSIICQVGGLRQNLQSGIRTDTGTEQIYGLTDRRTGAGWAGWRAGGCVGMQTDRQT